MCLTDLCVRFLLLIKDQRDTRLLHLNLCEGGLIKY